MADDVRAGEVVLKPIALDLCCGLGGWTRGLKAAGFEVWGFDIDERFRANYPGDRFYCSDVRIAAASLEDLGRVRRGAVVVASPPCEQFSRWQMPWTLRRNPPPPDLSIWDACEHIARELALPIVIENVRMAQHWKRARCVALWLILSLGFGACTDAHDQAPQERVDVIDLASGTRCRSI